ncbi:MAG: prepilin-type N-terminal cleavage/methylation domain-containing protein [Candidatus Saccharibacteria bacterium]|nr:prepilin-type N-terminal cleavage/methylation domain-containing protein [Candidatus Saccharibacteria bacterium]
MSLRKLSSDGFTIVELSMVMILIAIISTATYTFINTSTSQYLALQQDGIVFGDLAFQSQRIAQVVRGLTDISQASADEITMYAYFYPKDTYASLIRYYTDSTKTTLYADVTTMTANPPIGTPIASTKKTYTIISPFYAPTGINTFTYLDSFGATLAMPITDLHTIKEIKITLAVPVKAPVVKGNDSISLLVSLRNRKTNL